MKHYIVLAVATIIFCSLFSSQAIGQLMPKLDQAGIGYRGNRNDITLFDVGGKSGDQSGFYNYWSASTVNTALFSAGFGANLVSTSNIVLSSGVLYNYYSTEGTRVALQFGLKTNWHVFSNGPDISGYLNFSLSGDKAVTGGNVFAKETWLKTFQSKAKLMFQVQNIQKDGDMSLGASLQASRGLLYCNFEVEVMLTPKLGVYGSSALWVRNYQGNPEDAGPFSVGVVIR